MRTVSLLPTWIIIFLMQPILPKEHLLKGMALKRWLHCANGNSVLLGLALWVSWLNAVLMILVLTRVLKF